MKNSALGRATGFFYLFLILLLPGCQDQPVDLSGFVLHPDFEMTLVAAEPLVTDPVDLEFDANGDAYVLQMPGYPKGEDQSSIVKLIDTDKDGIYDEKVLYAENLNQASSLLAYKQGLLVAAPPDLLFLKDENGDGVAEVRSVIMTGFSNGNLQHNFNGLTYGLDNWIHLANGGNGGGTRWVDSDSVMPIDGYDFQIRPEDKLFQWSGRTSGGYELAMDKWGNFYGTHNLHHINMLVFPHRYIEGLTLNPRNTLRNISDHEENGLARVYPIGEQETRVNHPEQSGYFSGACGITYYGGGSFSPAFQDNIFVNDVVLNLVHRNIVEEKSSYYSAARGRAGEDFLTSRDRSFRPVNSVVGPDGALYIIDMYRQVIEHPEWIPDELEVNMDLDAGKGQGRIYRINQKDRELFEWKKPGGEVREWIALLEHPNLWTRMVAQRTILENKWNCAAELTALFSKTKIPETKIHILYILKDMGTDLTTLLIAALNDKVVELKRHAIICSEPYFKQNDLICENVMDCARSDDARLQLQTVLSIGQFPDKYADEAFSIITDVLTRNLDDPYIRIACLASLRHRTLHLAGYLKKHPEMLAEEGGEIMMEMIAYRLSQAGTSTEMLDLLELFPARTPEEEKALVMVLEVFARSGIKLPQADVSEWTRKLNELEKERSLALLSSLWKLRNSLGVPLKKNIDAELTRAVELIHSNQSDEREKIEAIQIFDFADLDRVRAELLPMVDARNPIQVQEAALEVLISQDASDVVQDLVDRWKMLSPTVRKRITDLLIYNPENHEILFSSLESGTLNLSEFNFDLERRRRLLKSKDDDTRKRAQALFSDAGVTQRREAIEQMRPALDLAGNEKAGEDIFNVQCATCHRFGSIGNEVGPDLTEISRKSRETLMHDILDPNAGADPEYINHIIETEDGQIISGIIDEETDDALFVKMMGGMERSIPKSNIKSLSSTGLSLMPEGLEGVLSQKDLADLLAFLQHPVM
ncbi:MAG: c-type cytochrome [Saprospiraceae bacterium]|nr:c-type cytochrome [Saprospiraceae bacterium]